MLRSLPAAFEDLCALLGCLTATTIRVCPRACTCVIFTLRSCPDLYGPQLFLCCLSHSMVCMVLLLFLSPQVCLAPGKTCSLPPISRSSQDTRSACVSVYRLGHAKNVAQLTFFDLVTDYNLCVEPVFLLGM